ncbi:hypothetical protein FRC10_005193 [Ceratobasidium sp. 414]|nr:hypothetical protein FRC10_005193 [Ceratobasidium sp. 414]
MPAVLSICSREHIAHATDSANLMPTGPPEHVCITITPPASAEPCALPDQGWFPRIVLACNRFIAWIVASRGVFATLIWGKKTPEHDLESDEAVDVQNKDDVREAIGHMEIASDAPRSHSFPVVLAPSTAGVSDVTLVAPSVSLNSARPSRFVEHLPDHPLFADAPTTAALIQPPATDNDLSLRELFPPLGEQDRLRMHEEVAARIQMPALRPFLARSTVSVTVVAPNPRFEPQQAIFVNPANNSGPCIRPKRSSIYYESYRPGTGPGLKEWVEGVRSGRNELTAMDPSVFGGRRLEVMIPLSPPSSPESSGPVTPTSEFMGTPRMLADEGKGGNLDNLARVCRDRYKAGGDGAAAL